jgi:hypothetical protein
VTSLTFEFGHTVPLLPPQLNATGTATLNLFLNDVHVGQTFLPTDNNVLVDQRVSFSTGQPFDRAVFGVVAYGHANDFGVGEVVDNINFTQVSDADRFAEARYVIGFVTSPASNSCGTWLKRYVDVARCRSNTQIMS